jgi:hypothetical protein
MVALGKQRKWQDKNKEHYRYCGTQKAVAHFVSPHERIETIGSSGVFRQEPLFNLSA